MERFDFYEKYGFRPTKLMNLKAGETYHHIRIIEKIREDGKVVGIRFRDRHEEQFLDLKPHWDRDPIQREIDEANRLIANDSATGRKMGQI